MTTNHYRFIAVVITIASALAAYILQPAQLELFSNQKLVAAVTGGVVLVLNVLSNWLPSISGTTAGDK